MEFEKAWEQLKQDLNQQKELSDCININKLLDRIEEIEDAERKYWTGDNLLF